MNDLQIRNSVYISRRPRRWNGFAFWAAVLTVGSLIVGAGFVWAVGVGN